MGKHSDKVVGVGVVGLRSLLAALQKVSDELTLDQVTALLTIAVEPGLSVNDLAERLGIPQQTISRHVGVLLGRYQQDAQGADARPFVVQEINQSDPRRRALALSERGRELIAALSPAVSQEG